MDQGLLPRRYAKALYKYAKDLGVDSIVYKRMQALDAAFCANPDLQHTIANPFVDDATKQQLIKTGAGEADDKGALQNFVSLLLSNHRIAELRQIALAYLAIYRKANNIYNVSIVSAAELSEADRLRLTDMIKRHLGDATAQFSFATDPDLIGGFVVNIDNERLDASVKNELKQLRLNLLK